MCFGVPAVGTGRSPSRLASDSPDAEPAPRRVVHCAVPALAMNRGAGANGKSAHYDESKPTSAATAARSPATTAGRTLART